VCSGWISWKSWNWFECAVGGVCHPQHTLVASCWIYIRIICNSMLFSFVKQFNCPLSLSLQSWFNSQHIIQTVSLLQSVQTSSQVHTVEKLSKGIEWQGHKFEPQPVPKGKVGGATTPLPTALYLHLYLYLTQTP